MSEIKSVKAKEILDSRKNPTVCVEIKTKDGIFKGFAPSGASKGIYEAVEIRDTDGRGVKNAIKNVNKIISPKIIGLDPLCQKEIDKLMIELDKTDDKSNLGSNAIISVSMAVCRAGAASLNLPLYRYISEHLASNIRKSTLKLPRPCFNIINGGAHAENNLDIQEFMVIPNQEDFKLNLIAGINIYKSLKEILKKDIGKEAIELGDEGGFTPMIAKTSDALDFIKRACHKYEKTQIGLDCAASQFYRKGNYKIENKKYSSNKLIDYYISLCSRRSIVYIEDPFAEEDWSSWTALNGKIDIMVIGDDLTVTNKKRLEKAINQKCIKGIIIKPNQAGTITETLEVVDFAKKNKIKLIVSHRSGETKDDFIADLAVGVGAEFIKSGAPYPKERMVKYDRLVKIEKELKK